MGRTAAERELLILAVKALLFLLMGYRERRSWLSFVGVGLLTQIPLSLGQYNKMWVDAASFHSKVFTGSLFLELFGLLFLELMLMPLLVEEHSRDRTAVYTAVAFGLGIVVFIAALLLLPV